MVDRAGVVGREEVEEQATAKTEADPYGMTTKIQRQKQKAK
jgi:hypothetical protein